MIPKSLCTILLLASCALAAPTKRPLPPGVSDLDPDFTLLRDHEEEGLFYLLPKRYRVVENRLTNIGDEDVNCHAVAEYQKAMRTALQAKQKLLETERALAERNLEVVKELDTLRRTGEPESERLTVLERIRKEIDQEQKDVLDRVEKVESSVEPFKDEITRSAGQISIRARLPQTNLASAQLKSRLGVPAGARLVFPRLVGVELYPTRDADIDVRDQLKKTQEVGTLAPEWNIRPLRASAVALGEKTLPAQLSFAQVEREISFDHTVSLYTFCALKKVATGERLLAPLRVSLTVAVWTSPLLYTSGEVLVRHQRRLPEAAWRRLLGLAQASTSAVGEEADPGLPSLYAEEGRFEPLTQVVSFTFPVGRDEVSFEKGKDGTSR